MRPNEYDDLLGKIKCSDDFRSRMREKLSSDTVEMKEYEESVSGTEVINTKHSWGKLAALAAAFVLVCGAVGGGAYYFLNSDKGNVNRKNEESNIIYSRLKADKDKYVMKTALCVFDGAIAGYPEDSEKKEKFFEYIDMLDINNEAKEITNEPAAQDTVLMYTWEDETLAGFRKMPRHIKFSFGTDEDIRYIFDLYESGYFTWTANTDGNEETKYYDNASGAGEKLFYRFEELYDVENSQLTEWNDVNEEEIKSFIYERRMASLYDSSIPPDHAKKHEGSKTIIFEVENSDEIDNIILSCEWERANEFDFSNYYSINGISISADGYMAGFYKGCNAVYKLADSMDLDILSIIWQNEPDNYDSSEESIKEVLRSITDEPKITTWEGTQGVPQGGQYYGTIYRYYYISDPEGFKNEIASLEWETCSDKEYEGASGKCWNLSFAYLKESGYLSGKSRSNKSRYFKLKNEKDKDRISRIADKYITMTDDSKLAEKIRIGIDNYSNLEADYVIEGNDGLSDDYTSLRGHLYYDVKSHKMYMNGEGTVDGKDVTVETVMNGEDVSAYRIIDKATGETYQEYKYNIVTPMTPRSPAHYIYACKGIEHMLAPVMTEDPEYKIRSRDIGGGKTEYQITGKMYDSELNETVVLTGGGQLISSERDGNSFRLENYVFDSDSFEMPDISDIYEQINYEENKRDYQLPEHNLFPELIKGLENNTKIQVITDSETSEMYGYALLKMFGTLDKEGGEEDFWQSHGAAFKSGSKHGDRHMKGYYTLVVQTEKYEFVIYIPDLRVNKPEWGYETVLIEKHYGTEDESNDSYFRRRFKYAQINNK